MYVAAQSRRRAGGKAHKNFQADEIRGNDSGIQRTSYQCRLRVVIKDVVAPVWFRQLKEIANLDLGGGVLRGSVQRGAGRQKRREEQIAH